MARKHSIEWHAPAPFWDRTLSEYGAAPDRFKVPALLRFVGDSFMDQLQQRLSASPARLSELLASAESWRSEGAGWVAAGGTNGPNPIKLFQPAHNRFYLAAASLICRIPGLPDRAVDAVKAETAAFVVRRLAAKPGAVLDPANPATYDEYGWFGDRQSGTWQLLPDRRQVEPGEERLPLFPVAFALEKTARRLHAGLVPVASREIYEEGARTSVDRVSVAAIAGDALTNPKVAELLDGVATGLRALTEFPDPPPGESAAPFNAQARETLILLLLQLVDFLDTELSPVLEAIESGAAPPADAAADRTLYDHFDGIVLTDSRTAVDVLRHVAAARSEIAAGPIDDSLATTLFGSVPSHAQVRAMAAALLGGEELVDRMTAALGGQEGRERIFRDMVETWSRLVGAWGDDTDDAAARADLLMILLDLADYLKVELPEVWEAIAAGSDNGLASADRALYLLLEDSLAAGLSWREALADADLRRREILAGELDARIKIIKQGASKAAIEASARALLDGPLTAAVGAALDARPLPPTPSPPVEAAPAEAVYVIRCVYERPQCEGFEPAVVSPPSRPFQLASFFDPDAPVRPIQIRMPADTSIKGLSRFPKGVSITMSKMLREQMARAQNAGLKNLTDGNVGGASFNLGVICSFSIPIITICALILLMIIVQLLNIIFWWLPFFRTCLPVRK